MNAACTGSVLELKFRVPFYQDKRGSWHRTDHFTAHDKVAVANFTQMQLQILVSGKPWAYLSAWSCSEARKIALDPEWLQAALQLFYNIQLQFSSKGTAIVGKAVYKENDVVALRALTKAALAMLNKEPATLAYPVINDDNDAKNKYPTCMLRIA